MAVLKKCCCCCQLRTGVTVLGCIGAVFALFHLTAVSYMYANSYGTIGRFNNGDPRRTPPVTNAFESGLGSSLPTQITTAVVSAMSCIILAWGASIGNRFMLIPWLVLEMIVIILVGIGALIGGIMCFISEEVGIGFVVLVFGGLFVAAYVYIWICVLSCFQELRDCQKSEENALQEMPQSLENIIVDYRPPEYEIMRSVPKFC